MTGQLTWDSENQQAVAAVSSRIRESSDSHRKKKKEKPSLIVSEILLTQFRSVHHLLIFRVY